MSDDFGDWGDLDEYVPEERSEKTTIPEGTHEFEIVKAGMVYDSKGGERLEVQLKHADPGYYYVKANPLRGSKSWPRLLGSLAKALGWSGNQLRDAVVDGSIVGKTVVARIWHSTGDKGGLFANVGEFHAVDKPAWEQPEPKPAAKPAKKAAARTPAAKVAAAGQGGSEDDIPF